MARRLHFETTMPTPSPDDFVLVVDDDQDHRELLSEALESRGYHTAVAANGQEALDYMRRRPTRPHVILLDSSMPVMDGPQFLLEQARDPSISEVPVVMVTASPRDARAPHTAGYLPKPVNLPALFALLEPMCPHDRPRSAYIRGRK